MKFNWSPGSTVYHAPQTLSDINYLLCDKTSTSTSQINKSADFKNFGSSDYKNIVGIALSGAPFGASLNDLNVDPLYPGVYGLVRNKTTVDTKVDITMG